MKAKNLILLTVIIVSITACNRKNNGNTDNTVIVNIQKLEKLSTSKNLSVSGNIEGNKTIRLGFLVAGKINYIAAEEGQAVKSGQLLASLDPESYEIAKDMADANLNQTQDEYNRLSRMYESKSISESDYVKITNSLKAADAQQRLQNKNLKDTKLYMPLNGVLLKRNAEVGEIINSGMPLFVVSDIYTVKINASVPESELHYLQIGNQAEVYVSSLASRFEGKVTEIGSAADATTRTFSVKIELKNPRLLLKPGMIAEIQIPTNQTEQSISVPAQSVLRETNSDTYVFIADTLKNIAVKRNISVGGIIGNNIRVVSGLDEGDLVIVGGQQKLVNGTSIVIK
ncbi:MAG: efflux RND transporter periplasmic adaptor subunit [Petrimonas sp.]|nr:efflux RND transporter periplasmic adaptor subunit [Petrimonas sp.]